MKTILIIIIIGLSGHALQLTLTQRGLKSDHAEEMAVAMADNQALEKQIAALKKELSVATAKAKKPQAEVRATPSDPQTVAESDSSPDSSTPSAEPAAPSIRDQRERLRGIYDGNDKAIADKRAILDRNLAIANDARGKISADAPSFAEQGDRINERGDLIGNKGVRTSDADRAKATGLHNQRLAVIDAQIEAINQAYLGIDDERKKLESAYDQALSKVK
jgi:hypothetical protein